MCGVPNRFAMSSTAWRFATLTMPATRASGTNRAAAGLGKSAHGYEHLDGGGAVGAVSGNSGPAAPGTGPGRQRSTSRTRAFHGAPEPP